MRRIYFSKAKAVIILACGISGACSGGDTHTAADRAPASTLTPPAAVIDSGPLRPGIRFNPETAKPGLKVGTLVLDTIDAQVAAVDSVWVGVARFRGELTLSGQTIKHFEPDARAVCFEADNTSAAQLPRWEGDNRRAWFCFENLERAAQLIAPPDSGRKATVIIDRFVIHRGLSDQVNSARLVRVIRIDATR